MVTNMATKENKAKYTTPYQTQVPILIDNWHHLKQEGQNFLKRITSASDKRNTLLFTKSGRRLKMLACLREKEIPNFAENMYIAPQNEYFVAKNPSKNSCCDVKSMCALENIVLDVNFKAKRMKAWKHLALKTNAANLIVSKLQEANLSPSCITTEQKMLRVWWRLNPNIVTRYYMHQYNTVKEALIVILQKILGEINHELTRICFVKFGKFTFSINRKSTEDNMGLVRIPDTHQPKTKHKVFCGHCHNDSPHYNLHTLFFKLKQHIPYFCGGENLVIYFQDLQLHKA